MEIGVGGIFTELVSDVEAGVHAGDVDNLLQLLIGQVVGVGQILASAQNDGNCLLADQGGANLLHNPVSVLHRFSAAQVAQVGHFGHLLETVECIQLFADFVGAKGTAGVLVGFALLRHSEKGDAYGVQFRKSLLFRKNVQAVSDSVCPLLHGEKVNVVKGNRFKIKGELFHHAFFLAAAFLPFVFFPLFWIICMQA